MRYPRIRKRPITRLLGSVAAVSVLLGSAFATDVHAGRAFRPAAAKPTYGGSYAIREADAPDCLDPQKTASASANGIDGYVFDSLLSIDAKGHYVGDLATKYKVASGGTRITFFLHKGVRFSNGDPLTAADVKYTFDRALNPATKSPATASDLAGLTNTKVINPYEVELILKAPNRPLLTNLAGAYTGILDRKWFQAHAANTCNSPVGSGPYKIQSTGAAFSDVVLVANKYHNIGPAWVQNKGVPWISRVEFKVIASDDTAISELLTSGIDWSGVPGTQLTRVKGNPGFRIHKLPAVQEYFIEFNTAQPPFNDPAVRKAFAELINRPDIIKAAQAGQGFADYGPLPPGIPFFDKAAGKYMPKYNVSAATATISAKHATGPYTFLIVGLPVLSTMAEIIQQAAAQAGMQLNIVTKSGVGDFISDASKGNFNVLALTYGYDDPDILYLLLHSSQGHGAGLNWTNETNTATLDKLLTEGRTTLKSSKVAGIYDQAQVQINKQLDFVGVVSDIQLLAIRSNIKGYHADSVGGAAIQDLYIKTK